MKLIARIFVVLRPNKPPSMVSSESYAKKLAKSVRVLKFIKTEDAQNFILNYNGDTSEADVYSNQIPSDLTKSPNPIPQKLEVQEPGSRRFLHQYETLCETGKL